MEIGARQPAAVHRADRVRRRRPADAGGDLRPRRRGLPAPGRAVRGPHPEHLRRLRQRHRGRRLQPRDGRLHGLHQGALEGVPRRAAAREDGDRRGVRRRGARRRRDARPRLGPGRLPRRRRARRDPPGAPDRAPPELAQARAGSDRAPGARAAARHRRPLRDRVRRPQGALRHARGHRAPRRRVGLRRVQARLRHLADDRLGGDPRLPRRHPREHPGDPLQRGGAEGDAVHPAEQPDRRPAAVPPQRDRLHGRRRVRAARHHQARLADDPRGLELRGAAHLDGLRRVLRRRQLRHERATATCRGSTSSGPTRRSR